MLQPFAAALTGKAACIHDTAADFFEKEPLENEGLFPTSVIYAYAMPSSLTRACAAARRAIGTRKGEQDT